MAGTLQTTLPLHFTYWRLLHWNLFLGIHLTVIEQWFRTGCWIGNKPLSEPMVILCKDTFVSPGFDMLTKDDTILFHDRKSLLDEMRSLYHIIFLDIIHMHWWNKICISSMQSFGVWWKPAQVVQHTLIWDTMILIWCHCNGIIKIFILFTFPW